MCVCVGGVGVVTGRWVGGCMGVGVFLWVGADVYMLPNLSLRLPHFFKTHKQDSLYNTFVCDDPLPTHPQER